MKYTKYLLSNKFIDINSLETNNTFLKVPVVVLGAGVAVMGILTILSLLPATFITDEYRNTKCKVIHYRRNHPLRDPMHNTFN